MSPERPESRPRVVIVAARDEEDRIAATLESLQAAFPGARLIVADDGSRDRTPTIAAAAGAELSSVPAAARVRGKGGAATAAALPLLPLVERPDAPTIVFCDGDLGDSAIELGRLAEAVEAGECDLAVASFARREGGGFGVALGFARWAVRRLTTLSLSAPISGQRALRGDALPKLVPFAAGFGMETAMTVDAARAGLRIKEIELDLAHRATRRTLRGFLHRARQLADFVRVYFSRRKRGANL